MKFETLLNRILENPALYIGNHSIKSIRMFINGYAVCLCDQNMSFEDNTSRSFQEYVQEKYNVYSHNWADIIEFYSSSEQEAFDNLVKIFNEFRKLYDGD